MLKDEKVIKFKVKKEKISISEVFQTQKGGSKHKYPVKWIVEELK